MEKEYEITGVSTYAHCFAFTVTAKNKKEAREKAEKMHILYIDPAMAEFQEVLIDEPIAAPKRK